MSVDSRPPPGLVLQGPFLTRREVGHRLGWTAGRIRTDGGILRITSPVGDHGAYPAFQFDGDRLRPEVVALTVLLRRRVDDLSACSWFATPIAALDGQSPLRRLALGADVDDLLPHLPEPRRPAPGAPDRRRTWLPHGAPRSPTGYRIPWRNVRRRSSPSPAR